LAEEEIPGALASLAETPGKGHLRPDLTRRNVLFYTLYQYMVVYRAGAPLEIVAGAAWQTPREAASQSSTIITN
jgi:plasmid stabilization system protein ParE